MNPERMKPKAPAKKPAAPRPKINRTPKAAAPVVLEALPDQLPDQPAAAPVVLDKPARVAPVVTDSRPIDVPAGALDPVAAAVLAEIPDRPAVKAPAPTPNPEPQPQQVAAVRNPSRLLLPGGVLLALVAAAVGLSRRTPATTAPNIPATAAPAAPAAPATRPGVVVQ